MGDEDYDHYSNLKLLWGLLGAAQDAPEATDFAGQVSSLIEEKTARLSDADMAQVTASLQNFVLKYEVQFLGREPSDFAPTETGGEVLWRLTEARRFDTRERMRELASESLIDAGTIIRAAEASGMNIGRFTDDANS
ncbi:hypothetical protein [Mycolicibacterium psychrotolerans]|uniref:Uncharacterized protein n=1 Tax=Mycolicibacterium psychrotolerans TaxID=216929 RepID=A0A7I7M6D6_9MYCO|nr:hypothetical protein [Mycolicibacterium psychrotolerans]BBX66939.1 hypothetical protein MPSYJ_04000 [Mycolicibacterium psychrotolerans]